MRTFAIFITIPAVLILITTVLTGCSQAPTAPPVDKPDIPAGHLASGHLAWGQWDILIDPESGIAEVLPARNPSIHANVTWFVQPPKCEDCLEIIISGWDPVERIADITMVLRNPIDLAGYDVKAIISDYDQKEFLEPDAYADFYTDGTWWDPYYVFAVDGEDNEFGPGESHAVGFQVYFPFGATAHATVTVDASWPGPQEEPWRIDNVIVAGPLQNDFNHYISFTCHVRDHQDNVEKVYANLAPVGPNDATMSDDGFQKDFLAGDGIWGLDDIVTKADPGVYEVWMRAGMLGGEHFTYQKTEIEVIDPLADQPTLYICSMMHAEEQDFYLNETTYLGYSETLRDLVVIFNDHGAKIAFQPDWTFIQGTVDYDPTFFSDLQDAGHGVDTHAHETQYDLGQVHDMLDAAGVRDTIIANGGFTQTWGDDGNWAAYVAHFTTGGGQQMFKASVAYKYPPTQTVDSVITPIRPSLTGDWMVHDPDGPLVYIPGAPANLTGSDGDFFDELPAAVDYALRGVIPGKINCFYWHDPAGLYSGSPLSLTRLDFWELVLADYFDGKVADGDVVWANFSEMYQLYLEWED